MDFLIWESIFLSLSLTPKTQKQMWKNEHDLQQKINIVARVFL